MVVVPGAVVRPGEEAAALAVLHVVVLDAGAGVDRLGPGHGQAGGGGRLNPRGRRPPGRFVHVGYVDGHVNGGNAAMSVLGFHRHRIAGLCLVVVGGARAGAQLAAGGGEGETPRIRPLQAVGQPVVIAIRRGHRVADVLTRPGVLGHGAGCGRCLVEGGGVVLTRRRWGRRRRRWRWRRRGRGVTGPPPSLPLPLPCHCPSRAGSGAAWGAAWARR